MTLVSDFLRQVLHEVAAAEDVQQLEPAADRERRKIALEGCLEQSELAGVAVRLRWIGRRMALGSVHDGVDIDAAREDDPVQHVQGLLDAVLARRYDERPAAGALDGFDVVERHERRRQLPGAPARRLRVRGDPDDRTGAG